MKRHQAVAIARYYARSSKCSSCHRDFHTRPRLIVHLQFSKPQCLQKMIDSTAPLTDAARIYLDNIDKEAIRESKRTGRPTDAMRKLFVPFVDEPAPDDLQIDENKENISLEQVNSASVNFVEDLILQIFDHTFHIFSEEGAPAGYQAMADVLATFELDTLTDAQYRNLETDLHHELAMLSDFLNDFDIAARIESFCDATFPPRPRRQPFVEVPRADKMIHPSRFQPEDRYKVPHGRHESEDWVEQASKLEKRETKLWKFAPTPRLVLQHEVFALFPFGGTRRTGDIPMQLSWLAHLSNRTIIPIVLDLGIHEAGDLLHSPTLEKWLNQMRCGRVCYVHAAPPCETWSVARGLPTPDGHHKPRPLRSFDSPWLLAQRDPAELRQLAVGTQLLRVALAFMVTALQNGVPGSLEHPAAWEDKASIWHLKAIRELKQSIHVNTFTFNQGFLGMDAKKPTTFLMVHNAPLKRLLQQAIQRYDGPADFRPLTGLDGDTWTTSHAKQYPPLLCEQIARAAIVSAQGAQQAPTTSIPLDVALDATLLSPEWDPYSDHVQIAPDYHGQ